MAERFWLSDVQWAVIEPLLLRLGGKPRVDDRRVISGILHRYREGLRWRTIPGEYGPRTTLFNRFNRWSKRGQHRQAIGRSRGGPTTKIHALADGAGRLYAVMLTAGQVHDVHGGRALLARVPPMRRLIADKAYALDCASGRSSLRVATCSWARPVDPPAA